MNNTQQAVSVFEIDHIDVIDNQITAQVLIQKDSIIYQAHFPGDPITPGVCQLQLIQDVFNTAFPQYDAQLQHAKQIKYVDVLRPTLYNKVDVHIEFDLNQEDADKKNLVQINASISSEDVVFFKGKLSYQING